MANRFLDDYRVKYPIYKDVDDDTLSEAIRQTYYSDISEDEYRNRLSKADYLTDEEESSITSKYKDTTPKNRLEKLGQDINNLKDGVSSLFDSNTEASNIADGMTNENNTKPNIEFDKLVVNKNIDIPYVEKLESNDSNIIDQIQSSVSQQANKVARAISKNVNRGLNNETSKEQLLDYAKQNNISLDNETLNALTSKNENYIESPKEITQKEADWSLGYSAQDRKQDQENMQDIRKEFDNENYFNAFTKSIKELPSILADSSGEMSMLLSLPTTALAIQTRVSEFEDEYIKNNGKKPDQAWYDTAWATQSLLLLGERFGLGKAGKIALNKAPKKLSTPVVIGGAGAYEGLQERGEYISEEYLTQKENDKSLLDISTSDDANFSQFLGTVAGTGIGAASKGSESIISAINPTEEQKKAKVENELINSINNTTLPKEDILNQVNTNQAYYQSINNNIVEEKSIMDKTIDGFKKLQEEIKANNEKPIEELLQKDLEVKVADEPTTNQILDNNIIQNQEAQNQDTALPVSTVEENIIPQNDENNIFKPFEFIRKDGNKSIKVSEIGNSEARKAIYDNYSGEELDLDFNGYKTKGKILPNDYQHLPDGFATVITKQGLLEDINIEQQKQKNIVPQNDESNNKDWAKDIKVSQGSTRANELLLQDLNKNNDEYIYELKEVQGDFGTSYDIDRRLATQEELKQKNKNRLIDTKFQNYFDNGSIDEDGFMTTKSMSKEQFKEFNIKKQELLNKM